MKHSFQRDIELENKYAEHYKGKRKILHIRPEDRKRVDEYIQVFLTTGIFPKKLSREGYGEYKRRLIIGRLQNRTLKSLADENGVTPERVRQIFARFTRFAKRKGWDFKREGLEVNTEY